VIRSTGVARRDRQDRRRPRLAATMAIQSSHVPLSSRLEELNRIPVGIFHLDLLPKWADFHLIAESDTSVLQQLNARGEIFDTQDDAIPSTRFLSTTAGHRSRTRRARAAQKNPQWSERDIGECRWLLVFQLKTKVFRIERNRSRDVSDLVAPPVEARPHVSLRVRCRLSPLWHTGLVLYRAVDASSLDESRLDTVI
jgi:hypothetical protein